MKLLQNITITLFAVLFYSQQAHAMTSVIQWSCEEFSTGGCTAPIPTSGTQGDMEVQSIVLPQTVDTCGSEGGPPDFFGVTIDLYIIHSRRGDLKASLKHVPSGKTAVLFSNIGGNGQDIDVTIESAAGTNIEAGDCNNPLESCVGTYAPEGGGAFGVFGGIDPAGEWQLIIEDDTAGNIGRLENWDLRINLLDNDGDGIPDCYDKCANDSNYLDSDADGTPDCLEDAEADLKKLIIEAKKLVSFVKRKVKNKALRIEINNSAQSIDDFMAASGTQVTTNDASLDANLLASTATANMRKAANGKKKKKARFSLAELESSL